eukprot:TRINITY_DN1019_c0_g4_i1.p1 TRINITY_DN1019_c0_g4~~TRINITY_DN1019_c0_g4_i1.p1  ORF type:complete len:425 (+),score=99.93 TRINITY_DN1019_c0_g4_i1:91-1365(+)
MEPREDEHFEKTRHARFTLTGVIASKDPQSAQRTHDSLQSICSTIVEAYRITNDPSRVNADKRNAILAVTTLTPQIEWLATFTRQETDFCRFYQQIHQKLVKLESEVDKEVKLLKSDFNILREEIDTFPDVFDNLLKLLETMTEFMKLCHAAEVCRAIEMGKDAMDSAYNLLHLEVKSNFVTQTQLFTRKTKDFEKATSNLVKIQEGTNEDLQGRLDNAQQMMKKAIPDFIVTSKDYILNSNPQLKEQQKLSYEDVLVCLEELNKILERVRVKYINAFDEDIQRATNPSPLEQAIHDVMQAVAKLRSLPPEAPVVEKSLIQEAVPKTTKAALVELDNFDATPEEKQELVKCVKQARDGPTAEFFNMQDTLSSFAEHIKATHQYVPSVEITIPAEEIEDDAPQDLLEAARNLCNSMRKLSITLDE